MHTRAAVTFPFFTDSRTGLFRAAFLAVSLGSTALSASGAQDPGASGAVAAKPSSTPALAALTTDEALAAIPVPTGISLSEKATVEAVGKVRKTPNDAVAWVTLGDTLAQLSRDSDDRKHDGFAEIAYTHALQINPRNADAMVGLAWVAGGRRDFDRSVDWAKRALAVDANNAAAFGLIGDAALKLGDYDAAQENYEQMMDAKPDLSSWSRGASFLWIMGGRSKAIWLMEKAIKAGAAYAENTAWCRAKYAMMLFDDGALLPAAQALAPALAAGSHNPEILLAAGTIAAAQQDFAAATQDYQKVLEAGPNPEALTALGDLCAAKGEKDAAEKYYTQTDTLYQTDAASEKYDPMVAAKYYADHDRKLGEALRLAETRKSTKNVLEADVLAWVYFKNGDLPNALAKMKFALGRNSADAEMQFHAGMIAAAVDDRPSAQKHLAQALSFNPHFNLLQAPVAVAMLNKLGSATPTLSDTKAP